MILVVFSHPVAADEVFFTPTVEQILDEYHQKILNDEIQNDTAACSILLCSGGDIKSLEEDTVETLNEAGYEAYHVTEANYDALEAELRTDFSKMGMNPKGSYIVVISGGAPDNNVNDNSCSTYGISPEIGIVGPPDRDGLPSTYTYNGVTYSVRYITVSYAGDENLKSDNWYRLRQLGYVNESWTELAEYVLTTAYDYYSETSVASVAALINDMVDDSNYISMDTGDMMIEAHTTWTRQFVEVYSEQGSYWRVCQCSEYAKISARLLGSKLNETTGYYEDVDGNWFYATIYSPYYFDHNVRLYDAVLVSIYNNIISHDKVNVKYYLDNGGLAIDSNSRYLFTHYSPSL